MLEARRIGQDSHADQIASRLLTAAKAIGLCDATVLGDNDEPKAPIQGLESLRSAGLLFEPFLLSDESGARSRLLLQLLIQIGKGSLSLGRLYEGHINALLLIESYGAPEQWSRAFALAEAGKIFGVWAAEHPPGLRLRTSERLRWLEGGKCLTSGVTTVDCAVVTARTTADETLMILVKPSADRADIGGWRSHGMRASITGAIDLSGLPVEDSDMLGAAGDYTRQPSFSAGAWRFLAVQTGAMDRLVEHFISDLAHGGRAAHPLQAMRIGEALICIETAKLWCGRAADAYWDSQDERASVAIVNLARRAVENAALLLTQTVQRGIGLRAFMQDCPMEKIIRDLHTYLRQPSPDQAVLDAAAAYVSMVGERHEFE